MVFVYVSWAPYSYWEHLSSQENIFRTNLSRRGSWLLQRDDDVGDFVIAATERVSREVMCEVTAVDDNELTMETNWLSIFWWWQRVFKYSF